MIKGRNLYYLFESGNYSYNDKNVVVFISHKTEDREIAVRVGKYLENAGINFYLDIKDKELGQAAADKDAIKVVNAINKGLNNCSHILCIVSNKTQGSWWVPYEIGYAKKAGKNLISLVTKDVEPLPEYIIIEKVITSVSELKKYTLSEYGKNSVELRKYLFENSQLITGLYSYLK